MKVFSIVAFLAVVTAASSSLPAQQSKEQHPGAPPPPTANPQQSQQAAPVACPRMEVRATTPPIVRDGDTVGFAANISGGDATVQPVVSWTLSSGMIKSGQGTRQIEVDSTGAGADRMIIADVWVGGYPGECTVQGRAGVTVAGPATKRDEFGELPATKEKERIGEFFGGLSPSHDIAYVIAYAGRNNMRGFARESLTRIRAAVIAAGMPSDKVATIDGGFRETATFELWAVPVGALAPKATPTLNSKDIVFPKPSQVPPSKKP